MKRNQWRDAKTNPFGPRNILTRWSTCFGSSNNNLLSNAAPDWIARVTTQDLLIALFHVLFFHGARLYTLNVFANRQRWLQCMSQKQLQPGTFSSALQSGTFCQRYSLAPFVSAIRRKKKAKANGYAVQVGWSLKNVQVKRMKNHSFGNCLYHLFMVIWGMVYYCFAHIIQHWKMMMTHTKSGPRFFWDKPKQTKHTVK